jgi:hypothetical protein
MKGKTRSDFYDRVLPAVKSVMREYGDSPGGATTRPGYRMEDAEYAM